MGSLTVFAEDSGNNLLVSSDLSSDCWYGWGSYDFVPHTVFNVSYQVLSVPAGKTATRQIWVTPTASGNTYVFKFRVVCQFPQAGTGASRAYFVYTDSQSGEEIILWDSDKLNAHQSAGNLITVTKEFPDNFGSSGSLNFRVTNNGSTAFVCGVCDISVTDMTTAKLDGALSRFGDRIQGFFDNLADKIKGFFIPSDGFFESVRSKFQALLSDHLGFLYEAPALVGNIFGVVKDWNPPEQPTITLPAFNFKIGDNQIHLWDEQVYTFDFLGSQPWSTLYSLYKTFVFVLLSVAMVNLAIKKYHSIVDGEVV